MRFLTIVSLLATTGLAVPTQISSHDGCLQVMEDFPVEAKVFCSIYLAFAKYPIKVPEWVDVCGGSSKISSACSQIKTSTSSSKKSSTSTKKTSSSSSSSKKSSTTTTPCLTTTSSTSSKKSSSTSTTVRQTSSSVLPSSSTVSSSYTSSSLTSYTMTPITSTNEPSSSSSSSKEVETSSSSSSIESTSIVEPTTSESSSVEPTPTPSSSSSSSDVPSTSSSSIAETTSSTESTTSSVLSSATSSAAPSSTPSSSSTSTAAGAVRTSPPAGAIVVDPTGEYPGSYLKVQLASNALSLNTTTPQYMFIFPGSYFEQVYIPPLKSNLTVQGYTTDATSYQANAATITNNISRLNVSSNDLTATVRQWNTNTKFYNLNIANTFGHVSTNGQNLAISAQKTNQGYYGVQFWGYQDTILANAGNQLYAKSLIVGAIDFIFGQTATAWFDGVDIRTIADGFITASGRDSETSSWYVINNSTVDGINATIPAGSMYLGRPWRAFARVSFQNSYLGAIIPPEGWRAWSLAVNGTTNTANSTLVEFGNYGPGSILEEGPRANWTHQLDNPVAIETVLGPAWRNEWWVDTSYMSF